MVAGERSRPGQRAPFFDVHPRTGATIEVFYADRALETFGRLVMGSVFGRFSSAGSAAGSRDDRGATYTEITSEVSMRYQRWKNAAVMMGSQEAIFLVKSGGSERGTRTPDPGIMISMVRPNSPQQCRTIPIIKTVINHCKTGFYPVFVRICTYL